jgi:hypothetical protein
MSRLLSPFDNHANQTMTLSVSRGILALHYPDYCSQKGEFLQFICNVDVLFKYDNCEELRVCLFDE